jgi:hypothetical protein
MHKRTRILGGGVVGAALGIVTVVGWWLVVLHWGNGGIDYPELEMMRFMGVTAAVWDGVTGLLWGAGGFRAGFAKGWGAGAVVRILTALLMLLPVEGLPYWIILVFALIAPLVGGVRASGRKRV